MKKSIAECSSQPANPPRKKDVWKMFDRIAHRYDLLNRLLSFGQDMGWRKRVAKHLKEAEGQHLLDLATGTGDLLIAVFQKNSHVKSAIGTDMAEKMLAIGNEKLMKLGLNDAVQLCRGDAAQIDFADETFDAVTIAFGIRNIPDVKQALSEMFRVLKKEGRVLILEFSLPANKLLRTLYFFYFRHILPRIGAVISGDHYAYRYLNETVETFPYGEQFALLMHEAGFKNVAMTPLTFGIATIYQGDK